jgi:hypothetical protein
MSVCSYTTATFGESALNAGGGYELVDINSRRPPPRSGRLATLQPRRRHASRPHRHRHAPAALPRAALCTPRRLATLQPRRPAPRSPRSSPAADPLHLSRHAPGCPTPRRPAPHASPTALLLRSLLRSVWRPLTSVRSRPFRRQPDLINDSLRSLHSSRIAPCRSLPGRQLDGW